MQFSSHITIYKRRFMLQSCSGHLHAALTVQYLAVDISANWNCEIHSLALDGFDHNAVHKLSSEEKKS